MYMIRLGGVDKKTAGLSSSGIPCLLCNTGLLSNSGRISNCAVSNSSTVLDYAVNNLLDRVSVNGSNLLSLVTTCCE